MATQLFWAQIQLNVLKLTNGPSGVLPLLFLSPNQLLKLSTVGVKLLNQVLMTLSQKLKRMLQILINT